MAKKNILDYINSNLLKEKSVTNFGITLFAIMVALLIFMITVRNTYDSTEIPPIKLPQGLCPCPDNIAFAPDGSTITGILLFKSLAKSILEVKKLTLIILPTK